MSVVDYRQQWPSNPGWQHPPGCGCGDCGCQDGSNWIECWGQIKTLKAIIQEILNDMGGPVKTGPILGVVDGSQAQPGQVGERLQAVVNGSFTAAASQVQVLSPLVLSPGDWEVAAQCHFYSLPGGMAGATLTLSPPPAGASYTMYSAITAVNQAQQPDFFAEVSLSPAPIQVNATVPTLLVFQLTTNQIEAANAGNFTLLVVARRMR